jgi:hypothetical protein
MLFGKGILNPAQLRANSLVGTGIIGGLHPGKIPGLYPIESDPDAKAYINAVVAAGGTVSEGQRTAINTFYKTGKADGWYSSLKRLYLPIWGVAAPNAICMTSLTSGTFVGTVTHAAGYVQSDGSTGYFNTGVSLSGAGCLQDSTSLFAMTRFNGALVNTQRFMGGQDTSSNTRAWIERYGSGAGPNNGSSLSSATDTDNRYFFIRSRTSSAFRFNGRYRNGVYATRASDTAASQGIMTVQNMVMMAINANGVIQDYSNSGMDFCSYGFGLGFTEAQSELFGEATQNLWEDCTSLTLT